MSIIKDVILNIVLMLFPILVYFIYNCYRELKCDKYNSLLLNVALFSSLYLSLKYGNIANNTKILLFCNIPIVVSYLKKEPSIAIMLSLITVIYSKYIFNLPIIIMIIKFISYLLIYILAKKKNLKDNKFIMLIAILQGFFISFEYFYTFNNKEFVSFIELIPMIIVFYLIPFIILYLFKLADKITNLHLTVSELEKDKQLKNSLFKITHEVKNPIAVCKGYLDMLDINNQEQINRYIPIVKQEIEHSLNIMSDFMEFSKIKIDKEIIDINYLLENIEEELKLLINSKNIKFICTIPKEEIFVSGDYNRLKQVFINMVKNSIESIENKGKITIITHLLKDKYYIEIEDTGCGMDEYTLGKIKEMFFTTKVKGSGLGVSLSNEIIKAHNGSINYISKPNKGTKVIIKLPVSTL